MPQSSNEPDPEIGVQTRLRARLSSRMAERVFSRAHLRPCICLALNTPCINLFLGPAVLHFH